MRHEIVSKPALNWNSFQLAEILTHCFEEYVVPFRLEGETFGWRFASEDFFPGDSPVWLYRGEPKAMALVTRRGQTCRLAAFAIRPELRGQGLGKIFIQQLIDAARERGDKQFYLEVILGNEGGLALYERMGFVPQQTLVGFQSSGVPEGEADGELLEIDPMQMTRRMMVANDAPLPWLCAAETLYKLPGKAFVLDEVAYAMVVPGEIPKLRGLFVEPHARRSGKAKKLLRLLQQRFPSLSTIASLPETVSPVFLNSGFTLDKIRQYEMKLTL